MKIPVEKEKKGLILFFSSTGRTQAPMLRLMEALDGDRIIALRSVKPYTGFMGFARAVREARSSLPAQLEPLTEPLDPARYDFAVIGTPVWAGRTASPVRTFLEQNDLSSIRQVAYVATHSDPREQTAVWDQLDALTHKKRVAGLSLSKQMPEPNKEKLAAFIEELKEKFAL